MTDEQNEEPKIIVDDDWKAQAQAEKEKLSQDAEAGKQGEGAAAGEGAGRPRELPPADFAVLVSSLVSQIFFALGAVEDPQTKKRYLDLGLAKHHIDMLAVLEEKTQGNLSDEEKKLLDRAIYETRIQYVNMAQRAAPGPQG